MTTISLHDQNTWALGLPAEAATAPTIWESEARPIMSLRERVTNFLRIYTGARKYAQLTCDQVHKHPRLDRLIYIEHTNAVSTRPLAIASAVAF